MARAKNNTLSKEPTFRQKKTIKLMVENGGKLSPAMRKAGYSEAYIKSNKLKKTKSWQELLAKDLPDEDLIKVAREGLDATIIKPIKNGYQTFPNHPVRHMYLETALKMKSRLSGKIDVTSGEDQPFTVRVITEHS